MRARACVHMVYSASGMSIIVHRLCRSGAMWSCRQERTVKPSAQPTLVRTQHLPLPAETALWLRKRDPAGRFVLVTTCISVRHCESMHCDVHGRIAERRSCRMTVGRHRRLFHGRPRTGRAGGVFRLEGGAAEPGCHPRAAARRSRRSRPGAAGMAVAVDGGAGSPGNVTDSGRAKPGPGPPTRLQPGSPDQGTRPRDAAVARRPASPGPGPRSRSQRHRDRIPQVVDA